MIQSRISRFFAVLLTLTATIFLLAGTAHAQGTSSSIRVVVTDASGAAVGNVDVEITHVPTGRLQTSTTTGSGVVTARGLAVGGPYTVRVAQGSGYESNTIEGITLELDETEVIALNVSAESIEEITVVGKQMVQALRAGVGRDFDRSQIDSTPSIARDFVSLLATEPKILVDNSVARGPAVSMAGQNFRFNSVTIDGVAQNDNFGLSKNASATQRTPISIDAIEAISVNIAPYDVTYGNFIGGNINIVTKSGTNDLEGSAYYFKTSDSWTGNKSKGVNLAIADFKEDTYGFTLGGPIVKDKLFFFVNYEKFETTVPSNTQTLDNIAGVTQADVDRVRSVMVEEYGFDPGPFAASDKDQDEKILLKVDWNINDDHRAVVTYQVADGDVLFDDFPEVAVLQSNRYNINEKLTSFSAQLFSNWTDRLSTEFKVGFKDVENRQVSVDTTTPDFLIFTAGGGSIAAGGDRFRHTNELDNKSRVLKLKADYDFGDHLLTAGVEQEEYEVRNLFLPFSNGQYAFFGIDALEARDFGFALYGNANPGQSAEANFKLAINSLYVQDEWTVSDTLTMKFGVRYDKYKNDDPIPLNPAVSPIHGFDNTNNLDGNDLVLPRFGFNWAVTDDLTLRGGAGLFGGGVPLIILSNSYSGNGVTRTFANFMEAGFSQAHADAFAAAAAALPDPTAAFTNFHQFIGYNPNSDVDFISPDFEVLSTWKYSLGADYVFGDDWFLRADVVLTDVKDGYNVYEGRRNQVGAAPDGRPVYDAPAFQGGHYIVTNTNQGKSTVFTLGLDKSFDTSFGMFDINVGYANQNVDELRSYNRFIGYETYAFDAQPDLNNGQVAPSKYEVEHRITANLRWSKELFGDNMTSLGLVYAGRSGRHYSYVFRSSEVNQTFGGNFLADFGSEGDNPGPMLFYVPTGTNDPLVTGDAAFLADLDTFISSEGCLAASRGSITTRNACETDWVNIVSLRLQQEIGVFGDTKIDLFFDVENIGNLINDDWGRIDSYTAPSNVSPATVAIVGNQYVLTPNASYNGTADTVVSKPAIARIPSVYRIQLGVKIRF